MFPSLFTLTNRKFKIMTIKSVVSNTPCKVKELSYPRLMLHSGGAIMLIVGEQGIYHRGTVIKGSKYYKVGTQDGWPSLVDFKGSVCLENDSD